MIVIETTIEPWWETTTTGDYWWSTTTADEPPRPDDVTYFNQTCCKEKGVPEECMGECISPRVLKQKGRSIVSNEDYAESHITICNGMAKLIQQCIVTMPRKHEGRILVLKIF